MLVTPGGAGLAGAAVPPGEVTSDLGLQDATARGWGPGAGGWAGGRSTPSLSCRPPALGANRAVGRGPSSRPSQAASEPGSRKPTGWTRWGEGVVNPMAAQDRLHLGHEGGHSRPPGRATRRPGTEEQGAPRLGTKWLKPQRQLCLQSWEGIFLDSGAFGPWPGTGGWEVHLTPVDGPTGEGGAGGGVAFGIGILDTGD